MVKKYQMNHEQAKELLPAIQHFANGGNLWCYDIDKKEWFILNDHELNWDIPNKACYIIEDKHFEARKAFALDEDIEYLHPESQLWQKVESRIPLFDDWIEYRPKPKKPIYDYHFTYKIGDEWYMSSGRWQGIKEAMHFIVGSNITKFEPSKRIRK